MAKKTPITTADITMANILYYARLRGIAQEELAAAAGFGVRTMQNRIKQPDGFSLRELDAIARKLGVHTAELLEDDAAREARTINIAKKIAARTA